MADPNLTAVERVIRTVRLRTPPAKLIIRKRSSTTTEDNLRKEVESMKKEKEDMKKQETLLENATKRLMKENIILKQKQGLMEEAQKYHHKCSECGSKDTEQNMQLCGTCHELKFVDIENVKKYALCPACAIKKHMRQGHQTVDFFPYLSAINFSSHASVIESLLDELKTARTSANESFSHFNTLSHNASEVHDVLTDMARRSNSTKYQVEFIEKMEMFIDKSKSIHLKADHELKGNSKILEETLTDIKNWYTVRKFNCVDDTETSKLPSSSD